MNELKTQLMDTWNNMVESVIELGPRVLTGIVLILLAWLIAKVVERVLRALLTKIKFDALVGKVGLDKTMQRMGVTRSLAEFLHGLLFSDVDHGLEQAAEVIAHCCPGGFRVPPLERIQDVGMFGSAIARIFLGAYRRMYVTNRGNFGSHFPKHFNDILDSRISRRNGNQLMKFAIRQLRILVISRVCAGHPDDQIIQPS